MFLGTLVALIFRNSILDPRVKGQACRYVTLPLEAIYSA